MQRAHAWDDPAPKLIKGGLSPRAEHEVNPAGTAGRVRDAAAWWPLSSCCQCGGTLDMSAPTLSVSAIVLSLSTGGVLGPSVALRRWRGGASVLVREVSPTGAPGPSCCCVPLRALLKGRKQIGPGRQSEPLRLGTVTADCQPGAAIIAAQRAARARWACGLALDSPGDRSRRVRSLTPRLGLCVRP